MKSRLAIALSLALFAGCMAVRSLPILPTEHTVVRDQLVIYSDFHLPEQHRLLEELVASRSYLTDTLGLPASDEPIHVYLFDTAGQYRAYLESHYPKVPARRAIFVESETQLAVYAHWGDRVAEDLRHEVAHGYLHSVVPNVPLWLDEGLAEYFEVPRGQSGLNRPHLEMLLRLHERGDWSPDLQRLESINDTAEMTQQDYAEAWAWVHFLLGTDRSRKQLLRGYLDRLRMTGTAPPLSHLILQSESAPDEALLVHLQQLSGEY